LRVFSDPDFRRERVRMTAFKFLRRVMPDLGCIGIYSPEGDLTLVHARDRYVTHQMVRYRRYRDSQLSHCIDLLDQRGVALGGAFLDIGANVGTETLAALRSGRFARAVAVEPDAENFAIIRANLAFSGLDDRVVAIKGGVSDRNGFANLARSSHNMGDHRVVFGDGEVPIMDCDTVLERAGLSPEAVSLVWIDTQGHEGFILQGAGRLIAAGVPFVVELCPSLLRAAGGLDLFVSLIQSRFATIHDLNGAQDVRHDDFPAFVARLDASDPNACIDLLLV
jgi:FkbM family methyltransferase